MADILGFVFAGASTVTALAMLLLVVWQAPRHRHNRLMAVYLATLALWGANNLAARACALSGCSPDVFMYGTLAFNGINAVVLFWFVTDYVGLGRRAWVRAMRGAGVLWLVLGCAGLYSGRLLLDVSLNPDGLWLYRLSPLAPPIFAVGHVFHLAALGCLWIYRRGQAGALLPGGVVLFAGKAVTVALLPFVSGVPPVLMAFTAAASVCFTYAILREHLFNPLARSQASLAVVLENTADPVWSVDPQRRLTSFNAAFRHLATALTGRAPAAGQDALELWPEEPRLIWSRCYERALRGERVCLERRLAVRGVPAHLDITFNPIGARGSRPAGVAVFARDVSAQARVVAEQLRAREAAVEASRVKSQFLAGVSHELRTPLHAALGLAQLLADRGDGPLGPRQEEYVESILLAGRHLLALINDLIDLSKIEAGKLDLAADRFTLGSELAQAVWLLAPTARAKGLELIIDVADEVPPVLIGDPRRLRQILVNLVGNAVKFTERGDVVVRVAPDAETYGGLRLRFVVVDAGVGIPLERQARLFEPFVPGDVAGDGSGLGLAITRRLVEAMGGTVGVESTPGSGTTVSFVLPFTRPPDAAAAAGADLAGAPVLVVDASDARREILGRWLTAWRARPTLVADADAARAALERTRLASTSFALLLVDVDVAGAMALLATSPGNRFVPAVLMSAATGKDASYPMLPVRVVRVRKPFSPEQLRASLAEALSGQDSEAPAWERRRRTAHPLRVLIAEDSLTNLAIASSLLERWGHVVTRADHGRAAVAAVQDAPYDLVLMDVRMPGIDGLEATRRIRASERATAARIPIVAMTASAMKGDRERCLEAGMDGYLTKPIDADELFELVERVATTALDDRV